MLRHRSGPWSSQACPYPQFTIFIPSLRSLPSPTELEMAPSSSHEQIAGPSESPKPSPLFWSRLPSIKILRPPKGQHAQLRSQVQSSYLVLLTPYRSFFTPSRRAMFHVLLSEHSRSSRSSRTLVSDILYPSCFST